MGIIALFKCNSCSKEFIESSGDSRTFIELRCIKCDKKVEAPIKDFPIQHLIPLHLHLFDKPDSDCYSSDTNGLKGPLPGENPTMEPDAAFRKKKCLERYKEEIEHIKAHNRRAKHDWFCPDCGDALKQNLNPMCPVCTSRDVHKKQILANFD